MIRAGSLVFSDDPRDDPNTVWEVQSFSEAHGRPIARLHTLCEQQPGWRYGDRWRFPSKLRPVADELD